MASSDYGPEIRGAMKETPADRARDKKRGIKEGSARDTKIDAQPGNRAPSQHAAPLQTLGDTANQGPSFPSAPSQSMSGGGSGSAHHAAMAAGIAHAILAHRGGY